jgi:hypothetical protein
MTHMVMQKGWAIFLKGKDVKKINIYAERL